MNGLHELWFGYFWPSLQGNGPEDLLSYLVIGVGLGLIGKWCLREWREHKAHLDHLHTKVDALHSRLDGPQTPPAAPVRPRKATKHPKDPIVP
jgi:hypothetical protein